MCFLRDLSADYAMATLLQSLPYRDWIVGVGLDSDEGEHRRSSSQPSSSVRVPRATC